MELIGANANYCPVCNQPTKEDVAVIYCENCGFSIRKKTEENENKPAAS